MRAGEQPGAGTSPFNRTRERSEGLRVAGHGAVRTIVPLLGKPVDAGRWVRTGARDPLSAAVVGLFRGLLSARPVVAPEPLPEALCPAAGECGKETARGR